MLKTKKQSKGKRNRGFQVIPHWNDPEIGYKALLKNIRIYVNYKRDEFKRLAPIISVDEFIWDTFSNMCRRDGYPQYDPAKNKGNFYSYVQTNCIRNQADWAKKRNVRAKQLAILQGVTVKDDEHPEYKPILQLDQFIQDSDDATLHDKVSIDSLENYTEEIATEKLVMEDIAKNISTDKISEKFNISWKEFATLLMKGWSIVDISKEFEINPTTTRKYHGILKERLLQNSNIQELLKDTGITISKK